MFDNSLKEENARLREDLKEERLRRHELEQKLIAMCDPAAIYALRALQRRPVVDPNKPEAVTQDGSGKIVPVSRDANEGLRELGIIH